MKVDDNWFDIHREDNLSVTNWHLEQLFHIIIKSKKKHSVILIIEIFHSLT